MKSNSHALKPLYLTLAAMTAAGTFFVPNATWPGASVLVATSLAVAFLSKEKIEDERVEHLKLQAIRLAFAVSMILAFLQAWLMATLRGGQMTHYFLSAFDMIILTMLIALSLYYYWRWQDGRAD